MHESSGSHVRHASDASPPPVDETLHVRPEHPNDVPFLLSHREKRFGGAFSASLVAHIIGSFVLVWIVTQAPPAASTEDVVFKSLSDYDIIWIPEEGPGGGGGGGGNESPDPPRQAELPGKDRLSIPAVRPPSLTPPKEETPPPPDTPPIPQVNVPVVAMGSGENTLPGVIEGLPSGSTTSQGSGSGGGAGTGRGTGIGPGTGSGLGPGYGGGTGGGAYRPGSGVTTPRVLREVKPAYTSDAMRAKIQGEVTLEVVVLPDGTVGNVEVLRSLDSVFGLDQEAMKAARQWRFVPGMLRGQPVPVVVNIAMTFNLR
ncbi:MAG: energy transducer TonB [Vicinamibacteraceae bacterium]|nr:energy transducer TonB [Vicinamibacteraceae bacterium]